MADFDYTYTRTFSTLKKIDPSLSVYSILPQLRLRFNFFFDFKNTHWIQNPNSQTPRLFYVGAGLCSSKHAYAAVTVPGSSLPYDKIRDQIGRAIGDNVSAAERNQLIEIAWEGVAENFPAGETLPRYRIYTLDFHIRVDLFRVLEIGAGGMVPAADSALGMLEKTSEAGVVSCCCICLEELGGGGGELMKMPCSHVFHGGCIEEWLRTSHHCPLCRYEMPMDMETI